MRTSFLRAAFALGLALPAFVFAQAVSITGGAPATETFDSLSASGTSSVLPTGWAFTETDTNANTTYAADTGSTNSGNTYSYGAAASTERAFGGLRSGSLVPTIGARLRNDTGATLSEIQIEYDGEQWRVGQLGRVDRLDFQYSLDATSLTTGAWVDVDALDFTAPVTTGTADSALGGNANAVSRNAIVSGLTLAANATIWIRWSDFSATGTDDGLAIDNFSVAVAGDNPPSVSSSPSGGASGVLRGASVVVTFSEPVTVTDPWFDLSCGTSGAHAASVSVNGTATVYTLDPAADFEYGESCTLSIEAAGVVDRDLPPDPLGANYRATFAIEVEPVDERPAVDTTVPANGATSVATNATLTVKFSEPVTTSATAFSLRCGNPLQPRAFAFAGSGSTYTLDPVDDFNEVETCELFVEADQVFDQDGTIEQMVADFLATFTTRAGSGGYYDQVDASSCVALRTTLHALIDDHTVLPYTGSPADVWTMIELADADPAAAGKVLDIYYNKSFTAVTDRDNGTNQPQGTRYNREHTWPQSRGFPDTNGNLGFPNTPRSDGHHLFASEKDWNADRGNRPFADCPPPGCDARDTLTHPITGGAGSDAACNYASGNCNWVGGSDNGTGSFEVWDRRKGDVARAIFYMDVRYEGGTAGPDSNTPGQAEPDLVVTDNRTLIQPASGGTAYIGLKTTLVQWHADDAVDAYETLRNDAISSYQENRNPFIDHPEWVAIAFAEPCTGTAPGNQPPVLANAAHAVLENAANGTTVATLVATDPNAGQQVSYAILSGNGGGAFALSSGGVLTVANAALVDPSLAPSHSLVVRATDNGTPVLSDDATITVNVTAVNDAPSFVKGADASVTEDAGAQSLPGWATAISAGPSDESTQTVSFEVTANTNSGLFSVAPAVAGNGTLTFSAAANASGSATITLRARDSGGIASAGVDASPTQSFVITVTAVDDVATAADDAATVGEDSGANTIAVLGNDSDSDGGAFVVTNVSSAAGGTAAVGPAGANVTFSPNANFCGATSFSYTVTGGDAAAVSVTVTCIDDAPVAVDTSGAIAAGSPAGTVVASVAASDADSATLTWSITSGNTGGAFAIDPATGIVTVAIPGAVQATSSPFALVVTVSDDSVPAQTDTATVEVTVTARGNGLFGDGFEGP